MAVGPSSDCKLIEARKVDSETGRPVASCSVGSTESDNRSGADSGCTGKGCGVARSENDCDCAVKSEDDEDEEGSGGNDDEDGGEADDDDNEDGVEADEDDDEDEDEDEEDDDEDEDEDEADDNDDEDEDEADDNDDDDDDGIDVDDDADDADACAVFSRYWMVPIKIPLDLTTFFATDQFFFSVGSSLRNRRYRVTSWSRASGLRTGLPPS